MIDIYVARVVRGVARARRGSNRREIHSADDDENVPVVIIQWPRQMEPQPRVLSLPRSLPILSRIRRSLDNDAQRENTRTLLAVSLAPRGTIRHTLAAFFFLFLSPRTCLSFAQSIMPLCRFVHMVQSLVKNSDDPSSDDAHPLHIALDDILLTGKWCNYKYHEQLPNVPHASCTDLESSIMLYVFERQAPCSEQHKGATQDPLDDKKRWLAEMEKRE